MWGSRGVQQHLANLNVVNSIHQAQMGLGNQREPVVLQTFDQVQLPQRSRSVEPAGEHPADELPQLGEAARVRQRRAADVKREVKVLIIDPDRSGKLRGNAAHPLPIPRHESDPLPDERDQPLVVKALWTGVEDVDGTDMAGRVCGVQGQQRDLEGRKPLRHASPSCLEFLEPLRYYRQLQASVGRGGQGRAGNLVRTSFVQDWVDSWRCSSRTWGAVTSLDSLVDHGALREAGTNEHRRP